MAHHSSTQQPQDYYPEEAEQKTDNPSASDKFDQDQEIAALTQQMETLCIEILDWKAEIARLTQLMQALRIEILDWKADNLVIERANAHLKDEIKRVIQCSQNQAQHWYALTDNIQRANKYITDHEGCDQIARDYKVRKDKEVVRLRSQKQLLLRTVMHMERTNAKHDKQERQLYEERMKTRRQIEI